MSRDLLPPPEVMRWLDLQLEREVRALRHRYELSSDEFRGLYISDEQVDALLHRPETGPEEPVGRLQAQIDLAGVSHDAWAGTSPRWSYLVEEFGLGRAATRIVTLAFVLEADLKYERIFAYLNDEADRKWPTHDLALRLFADEPAARAHLRRILAAGGPLYASHLLEPKSREVEPWPKRGFLLAPLCSQFLLGLDAHEATIPPGCRLFSEESNGGEPTTAGEFESRLSRLPKIFENSIGDRRPLVVLEGRRGSGRRAAARKVAQDLGAPLLYVDLGAPDLDAPAVNQAILFQRLYRTPILVNLDDASLRDDGRPTAQTRRTLAKLAESGGPLLVECRLRARWEALSTVRRCLQVVFPTPSSLARREIWENALSFRGLPAADVRALAERYRLTPGQIEDAVDAAIDEHELSGSDRPLDPAGLAGAARTQSRVSLGKLATRPRLCHRWQDLVLPRSTLEQVKEIADAIRNRSTVYEEWGFQRRLSGGLGMKALFAGPPGTGKTMSAGVIATDVGLDLYTIDLSGVVSKYIGETESNLDRIFEAARETDGVIFFDESDALFGKRSEVKDAHDRYANIEVAYLLQKMEEHDGIVILATNRSRSMDQAFARRMHHVVEFPLPGPEHRLQLWQGVFPAELPLAEDVDLPFLADHFAISPGDIRTIALGASFRAARDGRIVNMRFLVEAVARHLESHGRSPSAADFKHYFALLSSGA